MTNNITTLSLADVQVEVRKPGRPAVYTAEQRAERARAATKRSQQRRINKNAEHADKIITALTSVNLQRVSKEDKALLADALGAAVSLRKQWEVKEVDVPEYEWAAEVTEAE